MIWKENEEDEGTRRCIMWGCMNMNGVEWELSVFFRKGHFGNFQFSLDEQKNVSFGYWIEDWEMQYSNMQIEPGGVDKNQGKKRFFFFYPLRCNKFPFIYVEGNES